MSTTEDISKKDLELIEKALGIAFRAHLGQKDKAGAPYILHPLRIMLRMATELEMTVAVLHDVVEDTQLSLEQLRKEGIPEEALTAIDYLTRRDGEPYENFIERVKKNVIARKVKLADLEDNMDIRRLEHLEGKDMQRLDKYLRAWRDLNLDHGRTS
jgi:(p)ppGpp synthase/HD superfamily hydrolase